MTGQLWGKVMSVATRNLGEPTMAAALSTDTVLSVADASTFDEVGGLVTIGGAQYAYVTTDADADTITLVTPVGVALEEQTLVEVYPPSPVKTAQVAMGDDGDLLPATVPHHLLDRLTDGVRGPDSSESVLLAQRGLYDYVVADVTAEELVTQTLNYIEGEAGAGTSEAVVQMEDAQVTGQIGASVVAAEQVLLDGTDLAETLELIPGATKYALKSGTTFAGSGPVSNAELRMFIFDAGIVKAGQLYELGVRGLANGTVAGDAFWVFIRYTTDGSDPTTTSPRVPGGQMIAGPMPVGLRMMVNCVTFYAPAVDHPMRIAITAQRQNGTGTMTIRTDVPEAAFQVFVQPKGVDADSSTALQQTLKSDGSGSDNPPETTKTLSWQCTHSESFSGVSNLNGASSFPDWGSDFIGWNPDFGSPQSGDRPDFVVLHFNYADIVAKLATATSIESVQLKFTVKTREASSGLDVSVFAHKYTSFPWTMALGMSGEISAGRIVLSQGAVNDAAPGVAKTVNLLTAVGTNLKSGLYKGVGLTTNVYTSAGRGETYGAPSSLRPTLIIKFKSPA